MSADFKTLRFIFAVIALVSAATIDAAESNELRQQEGEDAFDFDTGKISGKIRTDGAYHGITRLTDTSSGRQFIDERYSALNLFKLMSVNQMMGQPRQMERTSTSDADWVEVTWAPTEGHAGTVIARYEIRPPDAIDLIVTVKSQGSYSGYEVFLSSYFDKALRPHVHLKSRGIKPPERVEPIFNEAFKDTLLVFPRDAHAARLCLDGRWDRNERNTPTIQLTPARHFAYGLAFMTDPELKNAVVLMARPEHVYAISTRYFSETEEERQTSYSAFDFALFGNEFNPGDQRSVRIRLAVISLEDGDLSAPLKRYEAFLEEDPKR